MGGRQLFEVNFYWSYDQRLQMDGLVEITYH